MRGGVEAARGRDVASLVPEVRAVDQIARAVLGAELRDVCDHRAPRTDFAIKRSVHTNQAGKRHSVVVVIGGNDPHELLAHGLS
jgi:hypothetical protein